MGEPPVYGRISVEGNYAPPAAHLFFPFNDQSVSNAAALSTWFAVVQIYDKKLDLRLEGD